MATLQKVYIETTIVSYLSAWPSRDVVRIGHQQTTRDWWTNERKRFELVSSQLVLIECSAGDPTAAADRLALLKGLPLLDVAEAAVELANALVAEGAIPSIASRGALHVCICATNG